MEEKEVIATLLRKLHRTGKIGHSHTPFENLQKGFPPEIRGEVKKIAKKLIREGLLLCGMHNYGLGVSLNHKRIEEMEVIIKEVFPDFTS